MTDNITRLAAAIGDRYVIEREIGSGGMATVYLARDSKHDREVAVKVLRPELGAILGFERFLAEVRITAKLDHPHILTLIDSGNADGFLYYVLPYVRGVSLRDKLQRETQLSLEETVGITRQIASALDFAHRHGVIHRDLKPENILLQEGEAMLADFGIALAVREAGGARLTESGLSLGTPQYMSPEQATGDRALDARSDVYSLGAMVYEMLAGEPPVTGATSQALIARLITEEPTRLRVVRPSIPVEVEAAVARALAKTPADRWASAGEFAQALRPAVTMASPSTMPAAAIGRWSAQKLAIAALAVAAVAWLGARFLRPAPIAMTFGRAEAVTTEPGLELHGDISPSGSLVAYATGNRAQLRILVRPVAGGRTIALTDDSTDSQTNPRWSPDGDRILFLTRGGVSVAPALGGPARPIVAPAATGSVISATWSPDGREVAFVRGDTLQIAPVEGGEARVVGSGAELHSCDWSSTGRWIACVGGNPAAMVPGPTFGNIAPSEVVVFPASGGSPTVVAAKTTDNLSPRFSTDGEVLLFLSSRDGPRDVYGIRLNSAGGPRGEPARLTTGLNAISLSLASDGNRLAYTTFTARSNIWSLPLGVAVANASTATEVTKGTQIVESMTVSHDGRWIVYDSNIKGNADVYRIAVAGGDPEQLTTEPWDEFAPTLSPDGRYVAYHSWRTGTRDIEVKPLDGGPVERVTATDRQESYPVWSPDGKSIAIFEQRNAALLLVRREGAGWSAPVEVLAPNAQMPSWTADGTSLATVTGDSVVLVPAVGGPVQVLFARTSRGPRPGRTLFAAGERSLVFKSHDAQGMTSFWSLSATGGEARRIATFPDPRWQSGRNDFALSATHLYFAVEDRQSDVMTMEIRQP